MLPTLATRWDRRRFRLALQLPLEGALERRKSQRPANFQAGGPFDDFSGCEAGPNGCQVGRYRRESGVNEQVAGRGDSLLV